MPQWKSWVITKGALIGFLHIADHGIGGRISGAAGKMSPKPMESMTMDTVTNRVGKFIGLNLRIVPIVGTTEFDQSPRV